MKEISPRKGKDSSTPGTDGSSSRAPRDTLNSSTGSSVCVPHDLSTKLTTVSLFAACAVVLIHSMPSELEYLDAPAGRILCILFSMVLTSFAVPLFFAISGYLFATKTDLGRQPHWYSLTLKKRVRTLLVPYLIWCTIYAATYLPFKILGNHLAGRDLLAFLETNLKDPLWSIGNLGRIYGLDILMFPAARSMWYVRNLLLLFVISPVFFPLFRKRAIAILYLFLSFIPIFFQYKAPSWNLEYGFCLRGLFYFPLGMYFAFYPLNRDQFRPVRRALPFLWIITALIRAFYAYPAIPLALEQILWTLTCLFGVGAVWGLPDFFPSLLHLGEKSFAKDTFFLYAIHKLFLAFLFCNSVEKILLYKLHIPVFGVLLLSASVALVLSLLTAEFMKRFLPKVYRILSGGR